MLLLRKEHGRLAGKLKVVVDFHIDDRRPNCLPSTVAHSPDRLRAPTVPVFRRCGVDVQASASEGAA
jgi:hypothetical protein